jgi:hypothetical protein
MKEISRTIIPIQQGPPIALDPANRRFAVAGSETITVVQLG